MPAANLGSNGGGEGDRQERRRQGAGAGAAAAAGPDALRSDPTAASSASFDDGGGGHRRRQQQQGPAAREPPEGAGTPGAALGAALASPWAALPARYKLVAATSLSFVICNMDKVNISVAIIPMARDFGWSPTTAGLVQSAFFYGYLLSQVPGGYLSSLLGGRRVLPAGVGVWSLATAAVPLLAGTVPGLFVSRAAVGLGEGVAPSAAVDIVARCTGPTERSRAVSFVFGGLHVGSLLGLVIAPLCIQNFGWPTVFYLFGGVGESLRVPGGGEEGLPGWIYQARTSPARGAGFLAPAVWLTLLPVLPPAARRHRVVAVVGAAGGEPGG